MRYAERTQVYRQASLIRRMIVGARAVLLKRRIRTRTNAASSLSVTDNLMELSKINKIVHYNVVSRLVDEANEDNKLEVGMICDGYLMRIDNLSPSNFFNTRAKIQYEDKIKCFKRTTPCFICLTDDGEITESTALKLRRSDKL